MEPSPLRGRVARLPDLVAHRGYAARFPENTVAALEAAIASGAHFVEVDVQVSADRIPLLFHDRTLDRMCGVPGQLRDLTLAEVRALSCAERGRFGERFATERIGELEDLVAILRRRKDVFAFVEIKRAAIEHFGAEKVLEIVVPRLEPVRDHAALISFSLPFLAASRARTGFPLGAVFDTLFGVAQPEAQALAPEYVFCDLEGLPPAGPLRAGSAKLAVYEVADPAVAVDLAARGVDLVETFEIGGMISAFQGLQAGRP